MAGVKVIPTITNYQDCEQIITGLEIVAKRYCNPSEDINKLHKEAAKEFLWPLSYHVQRSAEENISLMAAAVADREDVLEMLSEGLLRRYIDEFKAKKKIESQDFLKAILAIETLLMEWTCIEKMQEALVRVGTIHLLFQQLKLVYVSNREIDKYIMAPALTISNCTQNYMDLYMNIYGETDILKILEPYFNCSNPLVASCAKFIRNNFALYIHKTKPGTIDNPEHINELVDQLKASCTPSPLTAIAISLEPADVLKMLRLLSISEKNRPVLIEHPKFEEIIDYLLHKSKDEEAVVHTLNLLLSLLSPTTIPMLAIPKTAKGNGKQSVLSPTFEIDDVSKLPSILLRGLPHLLEWLSSLDCCSSLRIKHLCDAVVYMLSLQDLTDVFTLDDDLDSILSVCYDFKHYELVVYLSKKSKQRIFEMKARFQLYRRDQIILQRKEKNLLMFELSKEREKLYNEARKIVVVMVNAKEKDKEIGRFLDTLLMDIIRDFNEKSGNKLKGSKADSCFNCLLCYKFGEIIKGHFWPESHIRAIRVSEGDQRPKFYVKDRASMHKTPELKDIQKMVYYMFCGDCDNRILSIDEKSFAETILRNVYTKVDPTSPAQEHNIEYKGSSLYRFCLGVAFRGLALQKSTTRYSNVEKVYNVFKKCREVLLADKDDPLRDDLPVVMMFYTPAKEHPPDIEGHASEQSTPATGPGLEENIACPFKATIVGTNPQQLGIPKPNQHESLDKGKKEDIGEPNIEEVIKNATAGHGLQILNWPSYIDSSDFTRVSYIPLYSDTATIRRKAHFILYKHGIFNTVVLIEPTEVWPEYQQFIISPTGGTLHIPPNSQRMEFLPPALIKTYKEKVPGFIQDLLETDSRVHTSGYGLRSIQRLQKFNEAQSSATLSSHHNVLEYNINLLPAKYSIDRTTNKVCLPPNHHIILHNTQYGGTTDNGVTVLLAMEDQEHVVSSMSDLEPYVIVHRFAPSFAITLCYHVSIDNNFGFTKRLKDEKHRGMELLVEEKDSMLQLASEMLPAALENSGISSCKLLVLHHFSGNVVDKKCLPGFGCWYCSLLCEVCHTPVGYTSLIRSIDDVMFKFCSENCLQLYADLFDDPNNTMNLEMNVSDMQPQSMDITNSVSTSVKHEQEEKACSTGDQSFSLGSEKESIVKESLEEEEDKVKEKPIMKEHFDIKVSNVQVKTNGQKLKQLNDVLHLLSIPDVYCEINGSLVAVTMNVYYSQNGVSFIPISSNAFYMLCILESSTDQHVFEYYITNDLELREPLINEKHVLLPSHYKQLLKEILQNGLQQCNLDSLDSLI